MSWDMGECNRRQCSDGGVIYETKNEERGELGMIRILQEAGNGCTA